MVINGKFPEVSASGTPYEIGFTHGKEAADLVKRNVEMYKSMFMDYSAVPWDKATRYAMTFIPKIKEYDADLMEELQGVADGAGLPLADIMALNLRSEVVFQGGMIDESTTDGCTALAITPERTKGGHTLLAQNWDWRVAVREHCILLRITQKRPKPDIVMVTEAGIIGKIGFNSAGVGVLLNALASNQQVVEPSIPLHIALRGILNAPLLSAAIGAAIKMPLGANAHFLIAGANGEAVSVETGPQNNDVMYADEGYLAHANHFVSPRMTGFIDVGHRNFPDSFLRYGRMKKMLRDAGTEVTTEDVKEMLKDHTDFPDGICRHFGAHRQPGHSSETVFSIVMDLTAHTMEIAPGNPCETPYYKA